MCEACRVTLFYWHLSVWFFWLYQIYVLNAKIYMKFVYLKWRKSLSIFNAPINRSRFIHKSWNSKSFFSTKNLYLYRRGSTWVREHYHQDVLHTTSRIVINSIKEDNVKVYCILLQIVRAHLYLTFRIVSHARPTRLLPQN